MRLELIAFTKQGNALAQRLAQTLTRAGHDAACTRDGLRVEEWAARAFGRSDGLIFVGAAGIAVRAIAPHIRHKSQDPAVVVVDEAGHFAIPILSGHLGGANDLARLLSVLTGAQPVLTTATDVRGVFAADQWARRQGLLVCNPSQIQEVSSRLLAGELVGIWSRWTVDGTLPRGLFWTEREQAQLVLDWYRPEGDALWLCPKTLRAGVGCRRGTEEQAISQLVEQVVEREGLCPAALGAVCSIDLKQDELGLLAFCQRLGLRLQTYSARELEAVSGAFPASPFVAKITGVDNVCQRAALASGGVLLVEKTVGAGVTLALAGEEPTLDWRDAE